MKQRMSDLEFVEMLSNMADNFDKAQSLTDGELVDAVVEEVCIHLKFESYAACLLDVLTERFMRAKGIDVTPGGVTPDGERARPRLVR